MHIDRSTSVSPQSSEQKERNTIPYCLHQKEPRLKLKLKKRLPLSPQRFWSGESLCRPLQSSSARLDSVSFLFQTSRRFFRHLVPCFPQIPNFTTTRLTFLPHVLFDYIHCLVVRRCRRIRVLSTSPLSPLLTLQNSYPKSQYLHPPSPLRDRTIDHFVGFPFLSTVLGRPVTSLPFIPIWLISLVPTVGVSLLFLFFFIANMAGIFRTIYDWLLRMFW